MKYAITALVCITLLPSLGGFVFAWQDISPIGPLSTGLFDGWKTSGIYTPSPAPGSGLTAPVWTVSVVLLSLALAAVVYLIIRVLKNTKA